MEACSGVHQWARVMHGFGLTPKIMAAEFVKAFRKSRSSKNDRNDAEAPTPTKEFRESNEQVSGLR